MVGGDGADGGLEVVSVATMCFVDECHELSKGQVHVSSTRTTFDTFS